MNSIMKKIANFFLSIKNIIRWIPTLYKDREWDYSLMLEIEQKKLKNMIKWYEQNDYGHSVSGHRIVREMKLAVVFLILYLKKRNFGPLIILKVMSLWLTIHISRCQRQVL